MTFFKLFFHCPTFVIGKCLAIVLLVVATVFVPRFSEGNLSTTRNKILKFSHGGAVLLIKPSDEFYRFLPFVTNGGIGGRPNIKQDADIQEGFSKISAGSVKINESSNLSVSIFSEEVINNSADANANKKTETYLDQIEDLPRPYTLIHMLLAFFGVFASVFLERIPLR